MLVTKTPNAKELVVRKNRNLLVHKNTAETVKSNHLKKIRHLEIKIAYFQVEFFISLFIH